MSRNGGLGKLGGALQLTADLADWTPRPAPHNGCMAGRTVHIRPFDRTNDPADLWEAFGGDGEGEGTANHHLRYFGWPLLADADAFGHQFHDAVFAGAWSPCTFCLSGSDRAVGMASYMRSDPRNGVTEVGCVGHGAAMAGTAAATEAHYLMAKRVFDDLGYRRYEWKLNAANQSSHRAAKRLGFTFEGTFRQLLVTPRGNRDTAWYAMVDHEWPIVKAVFEAWLSPDNFDSGGRQIKTLEDIRSAS
ncbi:GNAT family N-acetyltransferase [Ahrensia sp. R2A130]|uniref:GNAT family N-acetyltransferase n=1 Tax=Ahrensia sp. R2A130 TaxID=744979 RepID=UPI000A01D323